MATVVTKPPKALCGAVKRQGTGTCKRPAGWGTDHVGVGCCKLHGGSTSAHRALARRTIAEGQVAALLAELGETDPQHPAEALLARHDEADRMVRALSLLVGALALRPDDDVDATGALYAADHLGDARPHVLVEMLGTWTDRHARIAKTCLDADLDVRRLQLDAGRIDALFVAVVRALEALDLPLETQQRFRLLLAAELRRGTLDKAQEATA